MPESGRRPARRDGDRRDAPVRRVRARGTAPRPRSLAPARRRGTRRRSRRARRRARRSRDVRAVVVRRDLPLPVAGAYVATEFARYAWETVLGRRAPDGRRAGRLARAPRPRGGRSDASDPLLPAVDDVAPARPQAHLRRRDRRRRRPRARDRLRAGEARHHEGGDPGEELHRRRRSAAATPRSSAPTTERPRASPSTSEALRLYEQLAQELDYNLLFSQQGHLTLAHTERGGDRRARARRGEQAPRRRLPGDLPGRDREALSRAGPVRPPGVPDHGRAVPPARRGASATTRSCGRYARAGRPDGRRDPPVHRGDGHPRRRTAR